MIVNALLVVAAIDFATGNEIRLYPLYFIPITIAAIKLGRRDALLTALAGTGLWVFSNYSAGLHYSADWIWVWNTFIQGTAFLFVAELVSELHAAQMRERELARVDQLTGLMNARAFHEQAPRLLSLCQRESHPVAMAYIDLDNFKSVNDAQGHQRGDDILRIAAEMMRTTLRSSDLLARIGGDEFTVIFPNATSDVVSGTLERLREAIASRMKIEGCDVTASIGAISYQNPASLDEMIDAADAFMYQVKQAGKDRVCLENAGG